MDATTSATPPVTTLILKPWQAPWLAQQGLDPKILITLAINAQRRVLAHGGARAEERVALELVEQWLRETTSVTKAELWRAGCRACGLGGVPCAAAIAAIEEDYDKVCDKVAYVFAQARTWFSCQTLGPTSPLADAEQVRQLEEVGAALAAKVMTPSSDLACT